MFLFVFYFQGAQGDDPITAGIKLAPMALGMLIASPLAGIYADRHGSRTLAALGMLVSAARARRDDDAAAGTRRSGGARCGCFVVGIGSGMFNSPNTAAMMGTVPANRRGDRRRRADDAAEHRRGALDRVRAGDRHLRGAEGRAVQDLLRRSRPGLSDAQLAPFIHEHAHRAVGAGGDVAGRRRRLAAAARKACERSTSMSATGRPLLRIGEVARRVGTTPRTIRYYEEIGLLARGRDREAGAPPHLRRADVERLREHRCASRTLLGSALDELASLARRGRARRAARRAAAPTPTPARAAARSSSEALEHIERQLELAAPAATSSPRWRPSWLPAAAASAPD